VGVNDVTTEIRFTAILTLAAFALTGCLSGGGDGKSDQGIVPPPPPPPSNNAPQISGNPPTSVLMGESYSFTPTASDADNDTLTFTIENQPSWASFNGATGQLSGQPTLGDVGVYSNIRIRVSDGTATASLSAFDVSVEQVANLSTTLSWTAPQQNEDGSALVDLAGYKIYRITAPGQYTELATIDSPGIMTYVVENLLPGTYEFVATAFNEAGIESRYSNPATKTVP
jgi:hypothetical protein